MYDIMIAMLIAYCFIEIVITFLCLGMYIEGGNDVDWTPIFFPSEWRRQTRLNWFGVIVASIGGFIFAPITYLCRIISWLLHVGRRD